jgi:hypothetical protein
MTQNQNQEKTPSITREEMLERHRQQNWDASADEWNEFSRRALAGLAYHPKREALESRLQRTDERIAQRSAQRRYLRLRRIMSIAAAAAVLLIAAYFTYIQQPAAPDLFADNFEYIPTITHGEERARNIGVEQRAGTSLDNLRASLAEAYEAGRYEDAEYYARAFLEEAPEDHEMLLYYGIIALGKGDTRTAIRSLAKLKQLPETGAFERPATWYLGLAYLEAGQIEAAKRLFTALQDGNDRYATQAKAILPKL